MAYDAGQTFTFAYQAVQDMAPVASGVYVIYTARRWVYVGESDDIQQSLFEHLNGQPERLLEFGPLSFSFETVSAGERVARQQELIAELKPAYASGP